MPYKLLISSFVIIYLSGVILTLNISKFNNISFSLFIIKVKQKNILMNKI
jgi:hypothetical protein